MAWWSNWFSTATDEPIEAGSGAQVQIENLSKRFQEGELDRVVLANVSLTFDPGEFSTLR